MKRLVDGLSEKTDNVCSRSDSSWLCVSLSGSESDEGVDLSPCVACGVRGRGGTSSSTDEEVEITGGDDGVEASWFDSCLAETSTGSTLACDSVRGSVPEDDANNEAVSAFGLPAAAASPPSALSLAATNSLPRDLENDMNHERLGEGDAATEMAGDVRSMLEEVDIRSGAVDKGGEPGMDRLDEERGVSEGRCSAGGA